MKRSPHVLAVMMVATAMCADRIAAPAAGNHQPQVSQTARSLASRIASNLQRVIPATRIHLTPCDAMAIEPPLAIPAAVASIVQPVFADPSQYRLPPPLA